MATEQYRYNIDLRKNSIFNVRIHNVTNEERTTLGVTLTQSSKGIVVFDTEDACLYIWSGDTWISNTSSNVSFNGRLGPVISPAAGDYSTDMVPELPSTTNLYFTTARARGVLSQGIGIIYDSTTGVIANSGVLSINGQSGDVTIDAPDLSIYALKSRNITSVGNGLLGGGDLNNDIEFELDFSYLDGRYLQSFTESDPVFTAWLGANPLSNFVDKGFSLSVGTGIIGGGDFSGTEIGIELDLSYLDARYATFGSDTNFANTDLTLDGARHHRGGGFAMVMDEYDELLFSADTRILLSSAVLEINALATTDNDFGVGRFGQGAALLLHNSVNYIGLRSDNATGDIEVQLPNANGRTLASSVNGNFADNNGEITISIPSPDLTPYELLANKATSFSTLNNTKYPTTQAVATYVTGLNYITGITSLMVTTALGFTPYNATNPNGYITSSSLSPYLLSADAASLYQPIIVAGTTAQYRRGDNTWQTLNTAAVPELTNLYFTNARAIAATLTSFSAGAGTVAATDTILQAIQKLAGNDSSFLTTTSAATTYIPYTGATTNINFGTRTLANGNQTTTGSYIQSGSINASSSLARGAYFNNTLVAVADNDISVGLDINNTFTNGAFLNVTNYGIRVQTGIALFAGGTKLTGLGTTAQSDVISIDSNGTLYRSPQGAVTGATYKKYYTYFNDFSHTSGDFTFNGSTSSTGASGSSNHIGIFRGNTGTGTTGFYTVYSDANNVLYELGGGTWTFESIVRVPVLSTLAERFTATIGFSTSPSNISSNGIFFLYDEGGLSTGSTASGNWQVVCRNNTSQTISTGSTPVPVVAGQWYRLRFEVNAASSTVLFYVDDVLLATISATIPSGSVYPMSWMGNIKKNTGTTNRSLDIDSIYVFSTFNTAR